MRFISVAYDRFVEAVSGFTIALLVTGIGLWREATAPALPGAHPRPSVYSVVSYLGYSAPGKNYISLMHLDALAAADPSRQWLGALSKQRFVLLPEENVESRFDLVIGPMFEMLGVDLVGRDLSAAATRLPLNSTPIREAVLSHAAALRWFGSPEAAVGKTLTVATLEWNLVGRHPADFEIVGVAAADFKGTNVEQSADFWIGINGWHDVVFPKQQVDDFRRHFAPASLMVLSDQPATFAARLQSDLRALGEPQAAIQLLPGTGYHPVRRARFYAIASGLVLGLAALACIFVLSMAAHAFLATERGRKDNWMRQMLGESPLWRLVRQARTGLASFLVMMAVAACALALVPMALESSALPIAASVRRGIQEPAVLGAALLLFAVFGLKRSLLAYGLAGWRGDRHLGTWVAGFSGLILVCLMSSWFVSGIAIMRLLDTLVVAMPKRTLAAIVVPLVNNGYLWMGSPAPTRGMEIDAGRVGWALATIGPDGGTVVSERASLRHPRGNIDTVVMFNRVSVNYFNVLGIGVELRCGDLSDWPSDGILVNRKFLGVHGLKAADTLTLVLENGDSLRLCGIADDAQVLDARAGLAPMVYRPLLERQHLGVAVTGSSKGGQGDALNGLLQAYFPDTHAGRAETVDSRLAEQLKQERQMVQMNALMMTASGGVSAAAALMLGAAALRRQSRELGTRRALGASKWQLVVTTLLGPSRLLWAAMASLAAMGLWGAIRVLGAEAPEWIPLLILVTTGAALWVLVLVGILLRQIDEHRLMSALKS